MAYHHHLARLRYCHLVGQTGGAGEDAVFPEGAVRVRVLLPPRSPITLAGTGSEVRRASLYFEKLAGRLFINDASIVAGDPLPRLQDLSHLVRDAVRMRPVVIIPIRDDLAAGAARADIALFPVVVRFNNLIYWMRPSAGMLNVSVPSSTIISSIFGYDCWVKQRIAIGTYFPRLYVGITAVTFISLNWHLYIRRAAVDSPDLRNPRVVDRLGQPTDSVGVGESLQVVLLYRRLHVRSVVEVRRQRLQDLIQPLLPRLLLEGQDALDIKELPDIGAAPKDWNRLGRKQSSRISEK